MTSLSILEIKHDTTVDGPGFRTAIYAAGCVHHCAGCHNPQSWNVAAGTPHSIDELMQEIITHEFAHVTFTGGDPFFQVEGFTELARRIKRETDKTIWCYTGYTLEEVKQSEKLAMLLPYIDVLVDGRYVAELRDTDLPFRGSSNQKIITLQKDANYNLSTSSKSDR
ncbi:MAG: anaerobic ribonucleoside-triphosphate reductase activating protein [Mangrovibacterium sp.]